MAVPQTREFLFEESLKLRIHESATGPRLAQCTSETVLPRIKSRRAAGRLRLEEVNWDGQYVLQ